MKKKPLLVAYASVLLFLGLSLCAVQAQLPPDYTGVSTTIFDSKALAPGNLFLASCGQPGDSGPYFLQILRNDGTPRAWKKAGYPAPGNEFYAQDLKVLPNGLLHYAQTTGWLDYQLSGTVTHQIVDEDFNVLESVQMGNGYEAEGHDFELLPNGHLILLGYYTTLADVRSALPSAYPRVEVSGVILQELDGNRHVVWQWRSWDHFDWSEFSDWKSLVAGRLLTGWQAVSVRLDPMDGNVLMATASEQMKISRQTGDVLWRLGGMHNQFTFQGVEPSEAIRQLAGHDFHRMDNGNYILLNNGAEDGSRTTQVHEYQLDEISKVATHIWQYIPATNVATSTRGSVQRLPNGNTLIGWGTSASGQKPDCTEVTSDGRILFELSFTNSGVDSYRAFRMPFPASSQQVWGLALEVAAGNSYDFQATAVIIDIIQVVGEGYNSLTVLREPYAPITPQFQGKAPRLLPVRLSLSQTAIESLSGYVSFDVASFGISAPAETTVYYRPTPADVFVPLPTQFNPVTGTLVAVLSQETFGDFAFGFPDVSEISFPPLLLEPESLQTNEFVTRVPSIIEAGRTYTVNQELPIALTWTPKGFASSYSLEISTNSDFAEPVVAISGILDARYGFSSALPNMTYYWRVHTANSSGISSWSTSAFTTVPPAIQITSPNGGETLPSGLPLFIQWDDNIPEEVDIDLYRGGVFVKTIATNLPSTVSYQWLVDSNLSPARDYALRIRSVANASTYDFSDMPFGIAGTPVFDSQSPLILPDGRAQIVFRAPGSVQATIMASTNLSYWEPLQTLTLTNETAVFIDQESTNFPSRFYRLRVP